MTFDLQELETLWVLVHDRHTYVCAHTQATQVARDKLACLENKLLVAMDAAASKEVHRSPSCVSQHGMNHPGFYSVVRYCPDIDRGEAVNVGVIVGAPGLGIRVRMAERNQHVQRRFGAEAFDDTRLTLAKDGLAARLKDIEPTSEALTAFGAAEASRLQISTPRPMVVAELDGDLLGLFERLVETEERSR